MPSCPEGTSCEAASGICLDGSGKDTSNLCGKSCLDKADCQLTLMPSWNSGEAEVEVQRCPRELFDPSVPKEQCGDSCPCWRIVPRKECTQKLHISPFSFEIMRKARCRVAPFSWHDDEVQLAKVHCSAR